jgi:hypothetical protein
VNAYSKLRLGTFFLLLATVGLTAVFGAVAGEPVWNDLWKELFWLSLGVLLVTLILESLLTQAQSFEVARRQAAFMDAELSQFGFAVLSLLGCAAEGQPSPIGPGAGRRRALRVFRKAVDDALQHAEHVDVRAFRAAKPTLLVSINTVGTSIANFVVSDRAASSRYYHGWSAIHQRLYGTDLDEVSSELVSRDASATAVSADAGLALLADDIGKAFLEMADLLDVDDLTQLLAPHAG